MVVKVFESQKVPETRCPHCGASVSGAASIADGSPAPAPGCLSVCIECHGLAEWTTRMTLAPLTEANLSPEERRNVELTRAHLRRAGTVTVDDDELQAARAWAEDEANHWNYAKGRPGPGAQREIRVIVKHGGVEEEMSCSLTYTLNVTGGGLMRDASILADDGRAELKQSVAKVMLLALGFRNPFESCVIVRPIPVAGQPGGWEFLEPYNLN